MIRYEVNPPLTAEAFIGLLRRSTLAERRPVEDRETMEAMVANANLTVCAYDGHTLVGVARSVTDFAYCCYLSDLAVDKAYQKQGIGKALIQKTKERLGPKCKLILLSAPAAVEYYPKIGFTHHPQAWYVDAVQPLK